MELTEKQLQKSRVIAAVGDYVNGRAKSRRKARPMPRSQRENAALSRKLASMAVNCPETVQAASNTRNLGI